MIIILVKRKMTDLCFFAYCDPAVPLRWSIKPYKSMGKQIHLEQISPAYFVDQSSLLMIRYMYSFLLLLCNNEKQ